MADGLSLVLWSLAEYFNYFSVTLIILCSGLMTAFIIRLNGDQWGRYHNGMSQGESSFAYQRHLAPITNPFFLRLASEAVSSLQDGVWLELSCLLPCEVHVFWGASISPVHATLLKLGSDLVTKLHTAGLWADICLARERHRLRTRGKHSLQLTVPGEVTGDSLGDLPRQRYPCVVVMVPAASTLHGDHATVVAMVSTIHLKDGHCPMQSHVITQYAKMAGHAVYSLQPLFFASAPDDQEQDSAGSRHDDDQVYGDDKVYGDDHTYAASAQPVSTKPADRATEDGDSNSNTASRICNLQPDESNNHRCEDITEDSLQSRASATIDCDCDLITTSFSRHYQTQAEDSFQSASTRRRDSDCDSNDISPSPANYQRQAEGSPFSRDTDCDDTATCAFHSSQRQSSVMESVLPECIVCQSRSLSCALLPCRHTCVCRHCFHKLDRCPMCRSHIESYFTLTDDDDDELEGVSAGSAGEQHLPQDWYSRFERFNQRLNNLLGFE